MAAVFFVMALLRVFLLASLKVVQLAAAALKKREPEDLDEADDAAGGIEIYLDAESQSHLLIAGEALRATEADRQRLHELVALRLQDKDRIEATADTLMEWLTFAPHRERTIEEVHQRFRLDEPLGAAAMGRLLLARKVFVESGWVRISAHGRDSENVAAELLVWLQAGPDWARDLEEVRVWLRQVAHGPREAAVEMLLSRHMVEVLGPTMRAKKCRVCSGAMVGPDGKLAFDCPSCTFFTADEDETNDLDAAEPEGA